MRKIVTASLIATACAIIAAVVVVYLRGSGTRAPKDPVLQRSIKVAASMWWSPNTTLHQVSLEHREHPARTDSFYLPADTKTEMWVAFDANRNVSGWYTVTTDANGKVYQTEVFTPFTNELVLTDLATGKTETRRLPHFPASEAGAGVDSLTTAAMNEWMATESPVNPAVIGRDAAGAMTYVITGHDSREYVDMSSYMEVQDDELAADGSVAATYQYPVTEVLRGNVVPGVTPIAGLTTTPEFPATATAAP